MIPDEHDAPAGQAWWGEFDVAIDAEMHATIGGTQYEFVRRASEWQVSSETDGTGNGTGAGEPRRYVFDRTDGLVHLTPALADRAVVMRPVDPVTIAPGAQVTIFVSSPVLVNITVGAGRTLLDESFPVQPSDKWFGRSTITGKLCYASRTRARLRLEDLPVRNERAITAVHISNHSGTALKLDRLAVPTPNLELYADADGMLYTQDVTLAREDDEAGIEIPFPHRALYAGSATEPFPVRIVDDAPPPS